MANYRRKQKQPRVHVKKNSFNNPYFKKKKKKLFGHRTYYSLALLLGALLIWVYFLFSSSIFKINQWEINGLNNESAKNNVEIAFKNFLDTPSGLIFKQKNIFLFKKEALENWFKKMEVVLESVNIEKKYPNKLILNVKQKNEDIILYTKDEAIILASDGTVLRSEGRGEAWNMLEISENATSSKEISHEMVEGFINNINITPISDYPIFYDAYYNEASRIGERHIGEKVFSRLIEFTDNLYSKTDIKLKLIGIFENPINPKIIAFTKNNWKIYINPNEDGESQFYKLLLVFNKKIQDINKPLEYIDLRFGDRVYIK